MNCVLALLTYLALFLFRKEERHKNKSISILKHWKQICESTSYWSDTKHIFGIQREKGQAGKTKLLAWYDHLIKVRNKCAHNRLVKEAEFLELNGYWEILEPRLIQHDEEGV